MSFCLLLATILVRITGHQILFAGECTRAIHQCPYTTSCSSSGPQRFSAQFLVVGSSHFWPLSPSPCPWGMLGTMDYWYHILSHLIFLSHFQDAWGRKTYEDTELISQAFCKSVLLSQTLIFRNLPWCLTEQTKGKGPPGGSAILPGYPWVLWSYLASVLGVQFHGTFLSMSPGFQHPFIHLHIHPSNICCVLTRCSLDSQGVQGLWSRQAFIQVMIV